MKRLIGLLMTVMLITSSFIEVHADESAKKEAVKLSLQDAIDKLMLDSYKVDVAEINLKGAQAIAKGYDETYDKVDRATKAPIGYSTSVFDRDKVMIVREFAEKQGPANYEAEINALQIDVREKYFQVLLANDLVRIRDENVRLQEVNLQQAKEKYNVGFISKNDYLQAEIAVVKAENELEEDKLKAQIAGMDFNIFLGYDIDDEVVLTDVFEPLVMSETTLEEATQLALEKNNIIKGVNFAYDLSKKEKDGMALRVNKKSSTYLKAEADFLEAENTVDSAVKLIELDVRMKYMVMLQGEKNIHVLKQVIQNTKIQVESAKVAYEVGQITLLELQQLQLLLLSEEIELSNSILDYNLAVDQYSIVMTAGTTTIDLDDDEN